MAVEVYFVDGSSLRFDKCEDTEESDNFYIIRDDEEDILAEIKLDQIKYIKWD